MNPLPHNYRRNFAVSKVPSYKFKHTPFSHAEIKKTDKSEVACETAEIILFYFFCMQNVFFVYTFTSEQLRISLPTPMI